MKKVLYKKINIFVLWILFYIVLFWPCLKSGYFFDDQLIYPARGNGTVLSYVCSDIMFWFSRGRVYPGWSLLAIIVSQKLIVYKIISFIIIWMDALVLGEVLFEITDNKRLCWIVRLLFPLFVSLDGGWFNSMYGMASVVPFTFLCFSASMLYCIKFHKHGNIKYQILSCFFLFISLGTYEVSYVLCPILWFISLFYNKKLIKSFMSILPQIFCGLFWVLLNVLARYLATVHSSDLYGGIDISLDIRLIARCFILNLSAITCAVNNYLGFQQYIGVTFFLKKYIIRIMICLVFAVYLIVASLRKKEGNSIKASAYVLLISGAIWFIIAPTFLISITLNYQQMINEWGKGYIVIYISTWGVTILASLIVDRFSRFFGSIWGCIILFIMCAGFIVPNQAIAEYSLDHDDNRSYKGDLFFLEAMETNLFEEIDVENDIILDDNYFWYNIDKHYKYLLKQDVSAIKLSESSEIIDNEYDNKWYCKIINRKVLVFARCELKKNPDDSICYEVSDIWLYVSNEYTDDDNIPQHVKDIISDDRIYSKTDTGRVYYDNLNNVDLFEIMK